MTIAIFNHVIESGSLKMSTTTNDTENDTERCKSCNIGEQWVYCETCFKWECTTCINLTTVPEGDWFCSLCLNTLAMQDDHDHSNDLQFY